MMHRNLLKDLTFAASLAGIVVPGIALADTKSDLQAQYAALNAAMESRQADQIRPLLAPDFKRTDLGGNVMNADQLLEGLARIPADPKRKTSNAILSLTENGPNAIVEQRQNARDIREGRDGAIHEFIMSELRHDTWEKTEQGWLLKTTEAQEMTISRDGTVMRTMKKGDPMPTRGRPGGPADQRPDGND